MFRGNRQALVPGVPGFGIHRFRHSKTLILQPGDYLFGASANNPYLPVKHDVFNGHVLVSSTGPFESSTAAALLRTSDFMLISVAWCEH